MGLEAGIRALKLGFRPQGCDLVLEVGRGAGTKKKEEEQEEKFLHV